MTRIVLQINRDTEFIFNKQISDIIINPYCRNMMEIYDLRNKGLLVVNKARSGINDKIFYSTLYYIPFLF